MVTQGPETTAQINKDRTRKDQSNTDSIPFRAAEPPEAKRTESCAAVQMEGYRALICDNIQYPLLVAQNPDDADLIDEIVELMTETVCARRKTTRVCGSDFPAEVVKSRLLKLDAEHIRFVLKCLQREHRQGQKHQAVPAGDAVQCAGDHQQLLQCTGQP